jgi:UDP-N-acetylmuramoyl-tripeptide--D-alanyl-D-alanine ligase
MVFVEIISNILFVLALGYYFMTNMQWYSYKIERVIFHHTKPWWHLVYFVVPLLVYFVLSRYHLSIIATIIYIGMLYFWKTKLDKPLVFTGRIKRFFGFLAFFTLFIIFLSLGTKHNSFAVIIPLFLAYVASWLIEKMLFKGFVVKAKKKLDSMSDMTVVGVTASYGKTSIKNYIAHLLSSKYKVYATPRSVNTFGGVVKDINEDLPEDTQIYVVEMGARGRGDIAEISEFVNPHYVVVGKIGPAHIEYFGSLENIRNTKMEILRSNRLKKAWVHKSAVVKPEENIEIFGDEIKNIKATLDGLEFEMDGEKYEANILGSFNAMNIAVAIKVAKELGIDTETIKERLKTLKPTPHRLQRIDAGGKLIIDDSFNGNIDGMLEGFNLASTYNGRKVLITPALVEVDDEFNIQVAKRADEVFDLVVITSDLNYEIFKKYVNPDKLVKLESKDKMQEMLIEQTKAGDLILFANDAPSFI